MATLAITELVKYNAAASKHLPFISTDLIPGAALQLSVTANNGLSVNGTGLYAAKPISATYSGVTNVLTITNSDATTVTVNLGVLAADKFLTSTTYNAATKEITLTMSDASTFVIPLADLIPIVTASSTSVTVSGNGQTGTPVTAAAIISPNVNNGLSILANGLFVQSSAGALAGTPPATVNDGSISTVIFGTNTAILGSPAAWEAVTILGVPYKRALYAG
jgi:hypothetical protein